MWKDLNMKERAAFIKVAVDNGILNINDIIGHYNKFAKGGKINKVNPKWEIAATEKGFKIASSFSEEIKNIMNQLKTEE